MLMKYVRAGMPALVAGALALGLAAPAGAATSPTPASVTHSVRAADAALAQVRKLAHSHPAAARKALARNRSAATSAALQAGALISTASRSTAAGSLRLVAGQFSRDIQTYTGLLGGVGGSLQSLLAQSLKPALTVETDLLGALGQLTPMLPTSGATSSIGTIGSVVQTGPGEIQSLTGSLGSGVPPQLQGLLSQALTTISGMVGTGVAMLKGLVPMLPPQVQATVGPALTQVSSALTALQTALQGAIQTISTVVGGTTAQGTTGPLGQILSMIQSLLGGAGLNGTGSTSGTGTTGTTGAGILAGLPIPSFLQSLMGNFGLGNLFGGFGLGGGQTGLPFGLSHDVR